MTIVTGSQHPTRNPQLTETENGYMWNLKIPSISNRLGKYYKKHPQNLIIIWGFSTFAQIFGADPKKKKKTSTVNFS